MNKHKSLAIALMSLATSGCVAIGQGISAIPDVAEALITVVAEPALGSVIINNGSTIFTMLFMMAGLLIIFLLLVGSTSMVGHIWAKDNSAIIAINLVMSSAALILLLMIIAMSELQFKSVWEWAGEKVSDKTGLNNSAQGAAIILGIILSNVCVMVLAGTRAFVDIINKSVQL